MTDLTFWSTMGQVSATFAALVIVALPIYLGRIRSAITEVSTKYPLKQDSSRLMYVAMWSNLSLFVLPLLTSLSLILVQEHPQIQPTFSCLVGGVLAATLVLNLSPYWSKATKSQFDLLRAGDHRPRKLLRVRISFGSWGSAAMIVFVVLLFLLPEPATASWAISLLKATSLLSIIGGLGIGIFDLAAFDTGNILFRVSENLRRKAEDRGRIPKVQVKEIDAVFARSLGLASDPRLVRRISQASSAAAWDPEAVEKQYRLFCERTILDYDDFKADVLRTVNPKTGCYYFV